MLSKLLLVMLCMAMPVAPSPASQLKYPCGIDVFLGSEVYKLKANLGDNITQIVESFMNGPTSPQIGPAGQQLVVNMLHNAAGGRCDACITMVEALTEHFRTVSLEARPLGQDALGEERVAISQGAEDEIANKICGSVQYSDYAPHVVKACTEWLNKPYRSTVLRAYEGRQLEPRYVLEHKREICTKRLNVCPQRQIVKVPGRCRACAEVFQTLDYYVRRDRNSLIKGGSRSKSHVAHRFTDLCDNLYLHYPQGRVLDTVQEFCEEVLEEYEYVITRDFGSWHNVKSTCTQVVGECTSEEFNSIANRLQLFHLNVSTDEELAQDLVETPRPEGEGRWGVHLEL